MIGVESFAWGLYKEERMKISHDASSTEVVIQPESLFILHGCHAVRREQPRFALALTQDSLIM